MTSKIELETGGSVWKLHVAKGDVVQEGQELFIMEVMKMEVPYEAPAAGTNGKTHRPRDDATAVRCPVLYAELDLILERSNTWNIQPLIGVRIKLFTKVDGHWQNGISLGCSATKFLTAVARCFTALVSSSSNLLNSFL